MMIFPADDSSDGGRATAFLAASASNEQTAAVALIQQTPRSICLRLFIFRSSVSSRNPCGSRLSEVALVQVKPKPKASTRLRGSLERQSDYFARRKAE